MKHLESQPFDCTTCSLLSLSSQITNLTACIHKDGCSACIVLNLLQSLTFEANWDMTNRDRVIGDTPFISGNKL
ncbi:hypothetical protein VNO77_30273 [Canavalia gladiata]|uniref:Uncharacterized protein n=1 Tax=Canavalia gladiata TaxID=3824 RepID=A0AAN9KPB2_CANGL